MGRELTVKIISKKEEKEYKCLPGKNLLEIIKDNGYFIDAICGGMGKCGKCTVIVDGEKKPACKTLIFNNCKVELPDQDIDRIVVPVDDAVSGENTNNETEVYACVDIGTTTICGALCDSKGNIIVRYNMLNHQRQYGADVMSRISAANKDSENLHNIIISDIEELIKKLIMNKKYKIAGVVISGNTTMMHIFRGYSCEGLGKYPYVPVSLSEEKISYTDVFE
ncbi:MAG: 2Fe-2S iron-sulfur cluster binding domain-containing protein, partial [Butyrivibrio sp.]|nr:2Fe-2S iron-sulfur cluster binding domain-containing protein [Butyrivibrio sp.]